MGNIVSWIKLCYSRTTTKNANHLKVQPSETKMFASFHWFTSLYVEYLWSVGRHHLRLYTSFWALKNYDWHLLYLSYSIQLNFQTIV